jgi:heme A synthase
MVTAAVSAFAERPTPLSFRSPFARLTLWTAGAVFFVLASGVLVAKSGSIVRCLGWPLYNEPLTLSDWRGWLLLARRLVAAASVVLILAIVIQAWRQRQVGVRRAASLVALLLLAEALLGIFVLTSGFATLLLVAYVAVAAALWAMLVALTVLAGTLPASQPAGRRADASASMTATT